MARPKSPIPALVHHKASGQGRVRIEGTDFYCGAWDSEEALQRYRQIIAEYLESGRLPNSEPHCGVTIAEIILAFWKHLDADRVRPEDEQIEEARPSAEHGVIRQTLRLLRETYGLLPATEFGPKKLKALRQLMIQRGWTRKSINRRMNRIRALFKWAASDELIPSHIWESLKTVSGLRKGRSAAIETTPVQPVDESIVNATLPHLPQAVADMARLQMLSACRPGEICSLRPCDIDRTGDSWEYIPQTHKTEHLDIERRIYFGPKAQVILERYLDNRPATSHCFVPVGKRSNSQSPPVDGKQRFAGKYNKDTYRRAVIRGCEIAFGMPTELRDVRRTVAKMKGATVKEKEAERARLHREAAQWRKVHCWNPNRLRHSRATNLRETYDLEAVQVVLGHSDPKTTLNYAKAAFSKARKIMADVG